MAAVVRTYGQDLSYALLQIVVTVFLMWFVRSRLRRTLKLQSHPGAAWALAFWIYIGMDTLLALLGGYRRGAEANMFAQAITVLTDSTPSRAALTVVPIDAPRARVIVWLIDESVGYSQFKRIMQPALTHGWGAIDYGEARSLANCSAQSNSLLRWGVNVETLSNTTDLKTTPTIWAYAKAAGYKTTLIDGQARTAQNFIWPPERRLIDEFVPVNAGYETDKAIASQIRERIALPEQQFIYVILRGAHFPYEDHYPESLRLISDDLEARYLKALSFSKRGFFDTLFRNLDRSSLAIFYTSDHGQVLKAGMASHCNGSPTKEEYTVPLLAFLPQSWTPQYQNTVNASHSHSQLFPTSIVMMGYTDEHARHTYDRPLPEVPKRLIQLGRNIFSGQDTPMDIYFNDPP